jgi:hypothetical protein
MHLCGSNFSTNQFDIQGNFKLEASLYDLEWTTGSSQERHKPSSYFAFPSQHLAQSIFFYGVLFSCQHGQSEFAAAQQRAGAVHLLNVTATFVTESASPARLHT